MLPRACAAFKHLQQQQQQRQGGDDFYNEQTMKLKRQRQRHSLTLHGHKGAGGRGGASVSLAAAAECSHRLLHLSHNFIKPDSPLPAFRAVGVGGVEVAQLHLHALTQHIATALHFYTLLYLPPCQLVLADDDQQRHAAFERLRQLLLELGVFGVAASEGREAEVCL
jgi:hypothetical protein